MIGIRFEIPNEWNQSLNIIFIDVDARNMQWYLASEEKENMVM